MSFLAHCFRLDTPHGAAMGALCRRVSLWILNVIGTVHNYVHSFRLPLVLQKKAITT
jgi:hypothetical protein